MSRKPFTSDMDSGEAWVEYSREQKERRAERLPGRQAEIEALRDKGFAVEVKNQGFHYRIDGKLDLFPVHRRYHFLPRNKRGAYRLAIECAMQFLRGGYGRRS